MKTAQRVADDTRPEFSIEDIKLMIRSGQVQPVTNDVIDGGILTSTIKGNVEYSLHYGWDVAKCLACDDLWPAFNLQMIRHIVSKKLAEHELATILDSVQIDDHHWKWFDKALALNGGEYHWFFLMAEKKPQAACLAFYPKQSAFAAKPLFYIEYVAVAPWNRENPMAPREFSGVGGILVKAVSAHLSKKHNLGAAFSLHSLPKAEGFYKRIGMVAHAPFDKDGLKYFEMSEVAAENYMVQK